MKAKATKQARKPQMSARIRVCLNVGQLEDWLNQLEGIEGSDKVVVDKSSIRTVYILEERGDRFTIELSTDGRDKSRPVRTLDSLRDSVEFWSVRYGREARLVTTGGLPIVGARMGRHEIILDI